MKPATLYQTAGWLSLVLMLLLASPGVRVVETTATPVAGLRPQGAAMPMDQPSEP